MSLRFRVFRFGFRFGTFGAEHEPNRTVASLISLLLCMRPGTSKTILKSWFVDTKLSCKAIYNSFRVVSVGLNCQKKFLISTEDQIWGLGMWGSHYNEEQGKINNKVKYGLASQYAGGLHHFRPSKRYFWIGHCRPQHAHFLKVTIVANRVWLSNASVVE